MNLKDSARSPLGRLFDTRSMQNSSIVFSTGGITHRLTAPQRLQTFHCFSELPKELRIAVWEEALKVPRTVTITEYGPVKRIGDTDLCSIKMKSLRAVWQPPELLQVNRESREEGLRNYVGLLSFFESGNPVWFNFENDWLCFDTLEAMRKLFEMEDPRSLPGIRAFKRPSFPFSSSSSTRVGRELKLLMMNVRKLMFQYEIEDGGTDIHNFLWKWKRLEKVVYSIPTFAAIGTAMNEQSSPYFGDGEEGFIYRRIDLK
jgi:hypothetical protein